MPQCCTPHVAGKTSLMGVVLHFFDKTKSETTFKYKLLDKKFNDFLIEYWKDGGINC